MPGAKKKTPTKGKGARIAVGGLRTLGAEKAAATGAARTKVTAASAKQARALLESEFEHAFALKEKMLAEVQTGGAEKGRDSLRQSEKLRSLIASLEGMSRFALKMGLITPAESREIYAAAMKRGLYEGWK